MWRVYLCAYASGVIGKYEKLQKLCRSSQKSANVLHTVIYTCTHTNTHCSRTGIQWSQALPIGRKSILAGVFMYESFVLNQNYVCIRYGYYFQHVEESPNRILKWKVTGYILMTATWHNQYVPSTREKWVGDSGMCMHLVRRVCSMATERCLSCLFRFRQCTHSHSDVQISPAR